MRYPSIYSKAVNEDVQLDGVYYLDFLKLLCARLGARSYFEIGTESGASLKQIECDAVCVDPEFKIDQNVFSTRRRTLLFQMTSDEFFREHDLTSIFPDGVDLAFLDGMHRFEFLLRDFMNIERFCGLRSVVLIHDCLPANLEWTAREFQPGGWVGDIWKLLPVFRKYRPDLRIFYLDCPPTGLVACTRLDPSSTMLRDAYYDAIDEMGAVASSVEQLRTAKKLYPLIDTKRLCENADDITLLFA